MKDNLPVKNKFENFERGLFEVGLKAALKHPKAKLWAKVNSVDNFSLAIFREIENAVLDDVILLLSDEDVEWLNQVCKNGEKELKVFILKIAAEAYNQLRN